MFMLCQDSRSEGERRCAHPRPWFEPLRQADLLAPTGTIPNTCRPHDLRKGARARNKYVNAPQVENEAPPDEA
jgi:hypothetical protein